MAKDYYIPVNHNQSGYVLNGMLETRKAVEGGVGVVVGFLISRLLPFNGVAGFAIGLFLCLALGFIGLCGVHGEPLSRYVLYMLRWRKTRKRPYLYNPNNDAHTFTAAEIHLESYRLQDALADTLDRFRQKFTPQHPVYIAGVNFEFAADPLMEQLASAVAEEDEDIPAEDTEPNAAAPELAPDELFSDTSGDLRRF